MNPIRQATLRLRAIVARRALERDMLEEMNEHLDRATERYRARGMSPAEARTAAQREFGNAAVLQEEARDARGTRWLGDLAADVRFALRYFARHKATTAIIVAVLALGTGANTLIFSILQAHIFRSAPAMPDDDALVRIWSEERATRTDDLDPRRFPGPELEALSQQREVFSAVAAWTEDEVVLVGDSSGARTVGAQFVTPNFFETLGIRLADGLGLREDAGETPDLSAVMSHALAEQLFGSPAAAMGQRILVNEVPVTLVGVAPPRFQGALRNMDEPALWIPLSARADITRASRRWLTDEAALSLVARLAPSVSGDRATLFARQVVANALPDSAARVGMSRTAQVIGLQAPPPGDESFQVRLMANTALAVGILILLVACANVSSLMVAAAVGRKQEIAVRLSLGASRPRLLRQLITESTLLALAGSAIGLTLAWWQLTYMTRTEIDGVDLAPDLGTFAFVLVMALATGILFGISPALHAVREGVANALRSAGTGATGRSRLQRGFVVTQIALSQPLLVLLATTLALLVADYRPRDPTMSRHVVSVRFRPLRTGAPGQGPEAVASLIPRIAERPDVRDVVPDVTTFASRTVSALDRQAGDPQPPMVRRLVSMQGTAPGWFGVVDVPIILGRDVSLADTLENSTDVPIVIGSDLARELWGEGSPIGRRLLSRRNRASSMLWITPSLPGSGPDSLAMAVVGVFDAVRALPGMAVDGGIAEGDSPAPARVYTARGKQWRQDRVLVRTRGLAEPLLPELQGFVRAQAPSLPVISMQTLEQEDRTDYRETRRMVLLACTAGGLALLLASLGLYGIVSLAVRQRTREIGIRIAVGAHPTQLVRMFLASGVRVSLVAMALGLPVSIVALKVGLAMRIVLAPAVDTWLIGIAIAAVLLAVASLATWVPARRASLVDPARTLRTD